MKGEVTIIEKILFKPGDSDEEAISFYVLGQTRLGGNDYILVTDSEEDEDGEALILKAVEESPDTHEWTYKIVSDSAELSAVGILFDSLIDEELEYK